MPFEAVSEFAFATARTFASRGSGVIAHAVIRSVGYMSLILFYMANSFLLARTPRLLLAHHKRLYERVLGAELTHYLGYGKGAAPAQLEGQRRENYRNGSSKKTLLSEGGKLEIDIARDRTGEFEPQFIRKGQTRFGGFDTKIIAMYAQGMTVREIKRFLEEQYKVEVSADLISTSLVFTLIN